MTVRLPRERALPDADAMLQRVLAEGGVAERSRRLPFASSRWTGPLVAAVVIVLVVLGVLSLSAPPAATPGSTGPTAAPLVHVERVDRTVMWNADPFITLDPPGDRTAVLSPEAARQAACRVGFCGDGPALVRLGLATWPTVLDHVLVYAVEWHDQLCVPTGGPPSLNPSPSPSPFFRCTKVALVDARNGAGAGAFDFSTSRQPAVATTSPTGGAVTDSAAPAGKRTPQPGPTVAATTLPLTEAKAQAYAQACVRQIGNGLDSRAPRVLASARLAPSVVDGPPGNHGTTGAAVLVEATGGVVVSCTNGAGRVVVGPAALTREPRLPTEMPTPGTAAAVKELLGAGTGAAAGGSNGSSSLVVGTWYLVGPDVASIRTRVTTGGSTGPWVVSSAAGGFVYRRVEIPSIPADRYVVDTDVVSREGTVIDVEGVTGRATSLG